MNTAVYSIMSWYGSLTQMSQFLVDFRGMKSISIQDTVISQKSKWSATQFTLIMHQSRRHQHAYTAIPAVFLLE